MLPLQSMQLRLSYEWNGRTRHERVVLPASGKAEFGFSACLLEYEAIALNALDEGSAIRLKIRLKASAEIILRGVHIFVPHKYEETDVLLCNGYQSWTETRTYTINDRLSPVKSLPGTFLKHFGDYDLYEYTGQKGVLHGWTYTFIGKGDSSEHGGNKGLFYGSLNERDGYTLFEHHAGEKRLRISKDCDELHLKADDFYDVFDLFASELGEAAAFKHYFDLFYEEHQVFGAKPPQDWIQQGVAGWTSWYNYYTKIDEQLILDKLADFEAQQVPIKLFQIDDGWQEAVGDWGVVNAKFPNGMKHLTDQIHDAGYLAGLWLAPIICEQKSVIYQKHNDWLLRDENGKPVRAAYNAMWRSWMYVLDFYHPNVQDYLRSIFKRIFEDWRFDMVKIDFMYAASVLAPKDKTRGQVMFELMRFIRAQAGDKIVLGCGVPLGAGFGLVDLCRIGQDVHLEWEMNLLKWLGSRERVSTTLAIHNTLHRHQLNGLAFGNDPDVSILRDTNNKLSEDQRYTLFFINQLFGSVQFVSDDISAYDEETLHLYLSQFPLREKRIERSMEVAHELYRTNFSIGTYDYIGYSNLSAETKSVRLEGAASDCFFHNRDHRFYHAGDELELAPYQSCCLYRFSKSEELCIAGSTTHIFPCSELISIEHTDDHSNIQQLNFADNRRINGDLYFWAKGKEKLTIVEKEITGKHHFFMLINC